MARIRTIKPAFFRHERLFDAEKQTGLPLRVAFAGLWTECDREGRFEWLPRTLGSAILPFDDVDFSRVLDALSTRGHLVKYACNGREYGYIPSWHEHQVINNKESASKIPAPSEDSIVSNATSTREARDVHASRREGKGKEGKGISVANATSAGAMVDVTHEVLFEKFWQLFPKTRAGSKAKSRKAFDRALARAGNAQAILDGVAAYAQSDEATKENGRFAKGCEAWLNDDRWTWKYRREDGTAIKAASKKPTDPRILENLRQEEAMS